KKKTGLKILVRLTDEGSIKKALMQYQKSLKEEFGDLIATEATKIRGAKEGEVLTIEEVKKMAEELPVVRIVDALLRHAVIQGASDIHIEPMEDALLIRYRIDGMLRDAMTLPALATRAITARIKVLSNLKLDESNRPQDGRFKMETDTERVSFRVSLLPTYFGEKTVMRVLRETGEGFTLDVLGFHGEGMERIHAATKERSGLILIAGPTGSGKTTTLYTILDILNTPDVNISTIEDPIEYQMRRVSQSQVDAGIGFTFANGLRSVLRQDPDIIAVGEIRDAETAALAIHAALTGHLVLATIASASAATAITRLTGMGVDPFLLSSSLRLVIGQRLVRKLSGIKEQYMLEKEQRDEITDPKVFTAALKTLVEERLVKSTVKMDNIPFCRPQSSQESDDGYDGRIGVHEVMPISASLKARILEGATAKEIETQARKEGVNTIVEDAVYKAARGITSLEEAIGAV
ncbi:GspE/PulE family protein, partial [Patescibacteria group bacterium]|nr:GspE/PulE family protein [Patescibacteria group bacterium]MBU1754743.1 GspE/PulE family protein [Patescibacteria group bacterium]